MTWNYKKKICVDFDGTIVDETTFPKEGKIKYKAIEVLNELKNAGYYISIYSSRNNPEIYNQKIRFHQMEEILIKNNIPFDEIIYDFKPIALFYIDDKAIRFTNWDSVLSEILYRDKKNV